MKHLTLLVVTLTLATACDKDDGKKEAPAKEATKGADPKGADPKGADPKPADPVPTTGQSGDAAAIALEMCAKEIEAMSFADFKTHDKLVAQIRHPRDPGGYPKDTLHAWTATKAAVVDGEEQLVISIVSDDTDPCAIASNGELLTANKNPAAQITIDGTKPGDYQSWSAADDWEQGDIAFGFTKGEVIESGRFTGMALFRVTKVDPGKSVELDVHACADQTGERMGGEAKHFAIGHVVATWCPQ